MRRAAVVCGGLDLLADVPVVLWIALQQLAQVDAALVPSFADDRAHHPLGAQGRHRVDLVRRADPARQDYRPPRRPRHRHGAFDVGTGQGAVARDAGVYDGAHRLFPHARGQLGVRHAAAGQPAVGLHHAGVGVDAGHQPVAHLRRPAFRQPRVARQSGADHHAVYADVQQPAGIGQRAHAAADLQAKPDRAADGGDQRPVVAAAAGGVQVDDMQPARAGPLQFDGGAGGVARVVGNGVEVASGEPHRTPVEQIDGGQNQHGKASANRRTGRRRGACGCVPLRPGTPGRSAVATPARSCRGRAAR